MAGIGHYILSNRAYFEREINDTITETADYLRGKGVGVDRIAKNHAVVYAGVAVLIELAKPTISDGLLKYTLDSAMTKIETSRSELLLADHFIECIDGFIESQGVGRDGQFLVVHMPTAIKATGEVWNKTELLEQLKLVDGYSEIKPSRALGERQKCWHFKIEKQRYQGTTTLQVA